MNKDPDKKTLMILTKLALKYSYAYGTEEWQSSSKDLQDELVKRGITDIKVYYNYKMPGGVTQSRYMVELALYSLYVDFDILNSFPGFQEDLKNSIENESERTKIVDYIKSKTKIYDEKLTKDCEELIKMNPELSVITDKKTHRDDILWGAVFGTAPENIEFYCNGRFHPNIDVNMDKQNIISEHIASFGVYTPLGILDPKTAEKIIAALEKNRHNINTKGTQGRKA